VTFARGNAGNNVAIALVTASAYYRDARRSADNDNSETGLLLFIAGLAVRSGCTHLHLQYVTLAASTLLSETPVSSRLSSYIENALK